VENNPENDPNALLQKKLKDILTENAHLKFDLEEFEIKFNALEKDNTVLEKKLEESIIKSEYVVKESEKKSSTVEQENKSLSAKLCESKKMFKDKTDMVDILEITVSNKVSEIVSLKEELENMRKKLLFKKLDTSKGLYPYIQQSN
jgi:hypothetical protein